MTYEGILEKEAAEQFKKEGATFVVVALFKNVGSGSVMLREMEIDIGDRQRVFSVAGRNSKGEAALSANFMGKVADGRMWYPFNFLYMQYRAEKALEYVARAGGVDVTDLEWSFIIEH